MNYVLNSLGKQIYSDRGHVGFLVKWSLVAPLCKKWSRNRDCDDERVAEMKEYFYKGGYIPRIIHLADVHGEGLVCYDGNHRREVFNRCDVDEDCVVDIMFDATQNDVYKAFTNINKAVQLPAIYLDEPSVQSSDVMRDILAMVKEYEVKYKSFVSTSARCHAPHFNRDTFTDNVYAIYKGFNGTMSIAKIGELLEKLNNEYAAGSLCRPHSAYRTSVIEKCKKGGLWLFLEKSVPCEHIEKLI